jgi:alpha-1,2-mannosyltransferase
VGIGLAAAIKLTPGIFLIYLLVSKRWRAALVAAATALSATVLAAIVTPDATRTYFTELLWDTSRIGSIEYVSNQSLLGLVSRHLGGSSVLWLCLVLLVLIFWGYGVRRSDLRTGFALTGVVACLVSPITWVHHLVWLAPGLVLLAQKESTRRLAIYCHVLLASCLVWVWSLNHHAPLGFLGANAYVFVGLTMLGALALDPVPVPRIAQVAWQSTRLVPLRAWIAWHFPWPSPADSFAEVGGPHHPASQWAPSIQVLASAHARHLR